MRTQINENPRVLEHKLNHFVQFYRCIGSDVCFVKVVINVIQLWKNALQYWVSWVATRSIVFEGDVVRFVAVWSVSRSIRISSNTTSWVSALGVCQVYQVTWLAMTTNERMNAGRYAHFKKHKGHVHSPFNKGFLRNCKMFFCDRGVEVDSMKEGLLEEKESLLV